MNKSLIVAGIQLAPTHEKKRNIKKAGSLIEIAASEGARIIALPQLFNTGWFPASIDKSNFSLAEEADGQTITSLSETAVKTKSVLIAPIFEKEGERFFNTAFIIGPTGEVLGKYRKVHVPQIPLWEERSYFAPGDLGFPVFKTDVATIGVQLCWDTFFPEGFRLLALKGAEIIFVPTGAAFFHSHKKWERAIAAAAHSNSLFIMRINRVGAEGPQEFYGRSFTVRPDGEFVSEPSGASEGVVLSQIDLSDIATTRAEWVFLKDRRPELYEGITERKE